MHSKVSILVVVFLCLMHGPHFVRSGSPSPAIVLKDGGVLPWHKNDVALHFYVTVENIGSKAQTVSLQAGKCCHQLTVKAADAGGDGDSAEDCNNVKPWNLLPVDVYSANVKNVSIFYVNRYLAQRRPGSYCVLRLRWRPADLTRSRYTSEQAFKVYFNQSQHADGGGGFFSKIWPFGGDDSKRGDSDVNCLVRYGGHKSYFNRTTKYCKETPLCQGEKQMLSPITNKCESADKNKWEDEHLVMASQPSQPESKREPTVRAKASKVDEAEAAGRMARADSFSLRIDCVHGNRVQGTCECDPGWVTEPFENKPAEDKTYTMCNIVDQHIGMKSAEAKAFFVVILIALFLVAFTFLVISYCRKRPLRRNNDEDSEDEDDEDEDKHTKKHKHARSAQSSASAVISEVKNRREIVLPPPRPYQTRSQELNTPEALKRKDKQTPASERNTLPHKAKSFDAIAHAVYAAKSRQRKTEREREGQEQNQDVVQWQSSNSGGPGTASTSSENMNLKSSYRHTLHMTLKGPPTCQGGLHGMKSNLTENVTGLVSSSSGSMQPSSQDSLSSMYTQSVPPSRSRSLTTAMKKNFSGLLTPASSEDKVKSRPPRPGSSNPFRRIQSGYGYKPLKEEEPEPVEVPGGQSELFEIGEGNANDGKSRAPGSRPLFWPETW